MARTTIEKIEGIKTQIQQLENEKKRLLNVQKTTERKARTRRLIERGAILESLIPGADKFTNEQIKAFLEQSVKSDSARKILDGLTAQDNATALARPAWERQHSEAMADGNVAGMAVSNSTAAVESAQNVTRTNSTTTSSKTIETAQGMD